MSKGIRAKFEELREKFQIMIDGFDIRDAFVFFFLVGIGTYAAIIGNWLAFVLAMVSCFLSGAESYWRNESLYMAKMIDHLLEMQFRRELLEKMKQEESEKTSN